MTRLVVFDLDGTLVDSKRDLANAANALVEELGGHRLSEDAVGSMVGEGAPVLVRRVLAGGHLDPDTPGALPRFLELYDAGLVDHTRPYDGVIEMLEALHPRLPLAVLTNKPQAATERLLTALKLDRFFQQVVGGDTPLGRKPDPAGIKAIALHGGVAIEATTLVGDSPIDLDTARRAGSGIVLVGYGFGFRPGTLREGERVVAAPGEIALAFGASAPYS
jgi:phosphoglycolate phosphatase